MQYRIDSKSGKSLSVLGFGCMRFPSSSLGKIDLRASEELVLAALDAGINYFDTAYLYPGNEEALGKIIAHGDVRDRMLIASKLPHSNCRSRQDFDKFFNATLQRLQTDHLEYYLVHNVTTLAAWQRLEDMGICEWVAEQKRLGRIGSFGFSFHGSQAEFMKLLDAYAWDFVQIQYNYANEHYQAGVEGLHAAAERGLPVFIMEPLLGGRLANKLPKRAQDVFVQAARLRAESKEMPTVSVDDAAQVMPANCKTKSPCVDNRAPSTSTNNKAQSETACRGVQNAFASGTARNDLAGNGDQEKQVSDQIAGSAVQLSVDAGLQWLWNQAEVTMVLSGMNTMEQLVGNVDSACRARVNSLGPADMARYERVLDIFHESFRVPCTGCNYCMPCPKGINIPGLFQAYNNSYANSWFNGVFAYFTCTGSLSRDPHYATDCVNCGKCMRHCPQEIKIPQELKKVRRRLQPPGSATIMSIASRWRA